jgi:hypothetical protein
LSVLGRITVFDNDGTFWAEQQFPFQGLFVFDRVRALAPQHLAWKDQRPFTELVYREAGLAKLDRALDGGPKRGWTMVSIKNDWKRVFPFDAE